MALTGLYILLQGIVMLIQYLARRNKIHPSNSASYFSIKSGMSPSDTLGRLSMIADTITDGPDAHKVDNPVRSMKAIASGSFSKDVPFDASGLLTIPRLRSTHPASGMKSARSSFSMADTSAGSLKGKGALLIQPGVGGDEVEHQTAPSVQKAGLMPTVPPSGAAVSNNGRGIGEGVWEIVDHTDYTHEGSEGGVQY
ncbi:hypothetical protein CEUSTIGMA_g864.t1 [Chlamydomonas eustigma]|uniref:Uncharacterized protein n=1 Tax=Chlamydomonas eustigma TaxID=1157962 RepID=A0A250WRW3_9CHLO|nr:hypothetical protein CEUSTIGMA_g864.t1 [Chlamydomonas eustigma]|eukprot:GAX73412.1 hypothetical protein CEUSTIGMA_g864.t1 [Chlamydomonas eustigma]